MALLRGVAQLLTCRSDGLVAQCAGALRSMAATSLSSSCPAVQLPLLLQHRQSGMISLLGSWHGMLSQTESNCLLNRNLTTSASQQPLPTVYHLGLYNLRDNPGARKQRIRVGRGDSARRGNYCGRGIKGKKARGRAHILYDGGQLGLLKFPISRERAPYEALYNQLSLYRVIEYVQLGLLDHRRVITMKDLQDTGCVSKEIKYGVMLYGSLAVLHAGLMAHRTSQRTEHITQGTTVLIIMKFTADIVAVLARTQRR
ncbi:hypothetical protein QJQ45_027755 [Haematococcus lacustris]|nr:hypothetical protein QJQ45_027755 [Haematococcus lacustris]